MENINDIADILTEAKFNTSLGRTELSSIFVENVTIDLTECGRIFNDDGEILEENFERFMKKIAAPAAGAAGASAIALYALGASGVALGIGAGLVGVGVGLLLAQRLPMPRAKNLDERLIMNIRDRDRLIKQMGDDESGDIKQFKNIQKQLTKLTDQQKKIGLEYKKILADNKDEVLQIMSANEYSQLLGLADQASEGRLTNVRDLIGKSLSVRG